MRNDETPQNLRIAASQEPQTTIDPNAPNTAATETTAPADDADALRPAPDMTMLMVRLAEIRLEVEGPPKRRRGPVWPWILGILVGLLLAPLVFGKTGCLLP